MRKQRGVALVMVLLVLLVLTALGITASVLMTQEQGTSTRLDQQRVALYVAEAGLRQGEQLLEAYQFTNAQVNLLLNGPTAPDNPAVVPVAPQLPGPWDAQHLGRYLAIDGTTYSRQEIELPEAVGQGDRRAFYALYVRNNHGDTSPVLNNDSFIRLISVGWVEAAGRPVATKIVEEEFNWSGLGSSEWLQKQGSQSGAGSGVYQE